MLPLNWIRWGFLEILKQVLKLRPHSLLVGGPPCGSWTWINRSTSGRSKSKIFGNTYRSYIREANASPTFELELNGFSIIGITSIILYYMVCFKSFVCSCSYIMTNHGSIYFIFVVILGMENICHALRK